MTTVEKGNITELEVQLELVRRGYPVFTPVNDGCSIDLIVRINGELKSVQVKKARPAGTGFQIALYTTAGGGKRKKYCKGDIDFFGTYFNGKAYLIPFDDCGGRNNLTLRLIEKRFNQYVGLAAKNYEI